MRQKRAQHLPLALRLTGTEALSLSRSLILQNVVIMCKMWSSCANSLLGMLPGTSHCRRQLGQGTLPFVLLSVRSLEQQSLGRSP